MGKWFLTDSSATVGWIMIFFSADPHEISLLTKWRNKTSPFARLRALRVKQILANFGLFLPKCFGFSDGDFFPVVGNISRFQGSISNARRTFLATNSRQLTPTYNPLFWPKTSPGGFKNGSKDRLNLWTIFHIIPYSKPPPPKTNIFLSSEL